jgi:hypothetical protein
MVSLEGERLSQNGNGDGFLAAGPEQLELESVHDWLRHFQNHRVTGTHDFGREYRLADAAPWWRSCSRARW